MSFDAKLLEGWLVCPKSKSALVRDGDALISVDPQCRFQYAILDGIPNMLIQEATELTSEVWSDIMRRHGRDPVTGAKLEGAVT